jgi:hypothetical protein
MRLNPDSKRVSSHPGTTAPVPLEPDSGMHTSEDNLPVSPRRAIVSINGRDVDEEYLMKPKSA